MELNKEYLDEIKQELVDTVAGTSFIVPEIFLSVTDMPQPTVEIKYQSDKVTARFQRRKEISNMWNNFSDDAISLIRIYHEGELLTFLNNFPQFGEVVR